MARNLSLNGLIVARSRAIRAAKLLSKIPCRESDEWYASLSNAQAHANDTRRAIARAIDLHAAQTGVRP